MKFALLLIMLAFASDENKVESAGKSAEECKERNAEDLILVKIEEDECTKVTKKTSKYIGVNYNKSRAKWQAQRHIKNEKKMVYCGVYKDEETAAYASDTLARKLNANGEQNLKLNFPNDNNEVYWQPENKKTSKYIGVSYTESRNWEATRRSKDQKKTVHNGTYKNEERAAHASDTLARELTSIGEQDHKLNFPDDHTEVYPENERSSIYIGVSYCKRDKNWRVLRRNKNEIKNMVYNGYYKDEKTAAHASDTLARKLMANCEQNHKLNFPDDHTEVYPEKLQRNKRKRSENENLEQQF